MIYKNVQKKMDICCKLKRRIAEIEWVDASRRDYFQVATLGRKMRQITSSQMRERKSVKMEPSNETRWERETLSPLGMKVTSSGR